MERVFPGREWQTKSPEALGFSSEKLDQTETWLRELAGDEPFHFVIARRGYLAAEWNKDIDPDERLPQASAAKSYYSCLLGVAVAEGRIPSADARVVDYYPEMMDVSEDKGPKPGRHAFDKDRDITFRQLIGNASGYMKPGEEPGQVFHYQTFGMNILTHALAKIYGLYDTDDPDRLPGCGRLLEDKIRDPIQGDWSYGYTNFQHPPTARINIFGNYLQVYSTARDTARIGHLWLCWGQWHGRQIVPEDYLRQATRTNRFILANEPEEKWCYGHGFWVNDHGRQWPDVPRDSYAARGAGAKMTWICPSLDLVITQNPGPWNRIDAAEEKNKRLNDILARILETLRE